MLTAVLRAQLKNGVEKVLSGPGNDRGKILETALVCDYRLPEETLRTRTKDLAGFLKSQGEAFRNVRFHVVKWTGAGRFVKETMPMAMAAMAAMGAAFDDYGLYGQEEGGRTLEEMTGQLKLFYARSKLVVWLDGGKYEIGDAGRARDNMRPFLHRKLLVWQEDRIVGGTEFMLRLAAERKDVEHGEKCADI